MGTAAVVGPAAAVTSAGALVADLAGFAGVGTAVTGMAAGGTTVGALVGVQSAIVTTAAAMTPFGWVVAAGAAVSGLIIVAGDDEMLDRTCWKAVLGPDVLNELREETVTFHTEHGALLTQVLTHCELLQSHDDGKLILKNKRNEYFALAITVEVPVHESGDDIEHDITVVHAVSAQRHD